MKQLLVSATLLILASPHAVSPAAERLGGDERLAERLDGFVEGLVEADTFSGAVLVAKDGKVLFRRAYGLASKEWGKPNRVDTKFDVASMTKMFTGVAVAQLAEQGELSFDDPVGKHLQGLPPALGARVTIHHLLTHTSGAGSYWKPELLDANPARFRRLEDYLPLVVNDPLAFAPGERWSYSNAGYLLLGAVVERASGRSYFDYVREHVFLRAGMRDTDFYEADRVTPNLALGYTKQNRYLAGATEWTRNSFLLPAKGGPAGGAFSTLDDLLRFDVALRTHKLLGPRHTRIALTGKVAYTDTRKYAYGFATDVVNGQRIVFHDGGASGISTELDMYPDAGWTVVVLSNYDHPAARPVVRKIQELLAAS